MGGSYPPQFLPNLKHRETLYLAGDVGIGVGIFLRKF